MTDKRQGDEIKMRPVLGMPVGEDKFAHVDVDLLDPEPHLQLLREALAREMHTPLCRCRSCPPWITE